MTRNEGGPATPLAAASPTLEPMPIQVMRTAASPLSLRDMSGPWLWLCPPWWRREVADA